MVSTRRYMVGTGRLEPWPFSVGWAAEERTACSMLYSNLQLNAYTNHNVMTVIQRREGVSYPISPG